MGRGPRNKAKTGDRALYKNRDEEENSRRKSSSHHDGDDDDPMYDQVDRYHNQLDEEFIQMESSREAGIDRDSEDEIDQTEAVMDLGLGGDDDSSSEDDDDEEDDSEDDQAHSQPGAASTYLEEEEEDDDDDDEQQLSVSSDGGDNDELPLKTSVRDWGRQKNDYYNGDTADLELGQEEDDAFVEEQAAKEIQAARYQQMKEEDFALSDDEAGDDDGSNDAGAEASTPNEITPDVGKLSRSEKAKLLDRQHPELLALVSHFSSVLRQWKDQTDVVTSALLEGEEGTAKSVGATPLGQQYLINKAMLQSSAGLNLAAYLLLKSEHASSGTDLDPSLMQTHHPVMKHLHKVNSLLHKLEEQVEDKVPGLNDQMEKLAKASALLAHGEVDLRNDDDEEEEAESSQEEEDSSDSDGDDEVSAEKISQESVMNDPRIIASDESASEESDDEAVMNEQARARLIANEARFGLRANEVSTAAATKSLKVRRRAPIADFGDAEDEYTEQASKSLAATLNAIEQRSAVRKRKNFPSADKIDVENEEDRMQRGLAMMEEDLGQDLGQASAEDNEMGDDSKGVFDPEQEDDDFYAQVAKKSKGKKDFKKQLYAVQPKYPRMEEEIEGERAISRTILKNRGLVPHKNKLNRNPRVKKREQYRKALIRRRGAVREIRKDEGHKYGGEATGIKTNISRSRRFAS